MKFKIPISLIAFGLSIGLIAVLLKFLNYNFWIHSINSEVYIGIIALLFMVIGIWAGTKWTNREDKQQRTSVDMNLKDPPAQLGLSTREKEVLQCIVKGYSNQEIADELFISLSTVKTHVSNLFSKLDIKRRTQAIQRVKELNLFTEEMP